MTQLLSEKREPLRFTRLVAAVKTEMDIQLAPCTAIVGLNMSFKTAVIDAYRLALTGRHPIGSHPADIFELAAPGQNSVFASLHSASGGKLTFQMDAPKGKPKTPEHDTLSVLGLLKDEDYDRLMPMASVGELLRGAATVREAIIKRFGGASFIPAPSAALAPDQLKLWGDVIDEARAEVGITTDATVVLAGAGGVIRSRKARKAKEASTLEKSINERATIVNEAGAGAEMIPGLERQMAKAQAWETTANLRTRKDILEQAVAAAAPFTADPVEIKVDADLIKEVSAKLAAAEKTLALSNTVLLLANASAECCRLCKATALPKARKTEIETNNADLSKTVDALRKEYTAVTTDQQASQALINKAATDRASWQASRERALGELEGIKTALANVPVSYEGPSANDLARQLASLRGATTARESLAGDIAKLRDLRQEFEDLKSLEKEAVRLLTELLETVGKKATDAVNKYMPPDLRAHLEVTEKMCQWRVIGTDRRAHRKGGMSGREMGSLCVALACAWTEGAPVRVIILEDVDLGPFDPINIRVLLDTIRESIERGELTQALCVWSRPSEIPDGWLKVHRGQ